MSAHCEPAFTVKRGDTHQPMRVDVYDDDVKLTAADLAGLQQVSIWFKNQRTSATFTRGAQVVDDQVVYEFEWFDDFRPGDYFVELNLRWADGTEQTTPTSGAVALRVEQPISDAA